MAGLKDSPPCYWESFFAYKISYVRIAQQQPLILAYAECVFLSSFVKCFQYFLELPFTLQPILPFFGFRIYIYSQLKSSGVGLFKKSITCW